MSLVNTYLLKEREDKHEAEKTVLEFAELHVKIVMESWTLFRIAGWVFSGMLMEVGAQKGPSP